MTTTVQAIPDKPRWILAPAVALAAFMEVLDISIANVALQHIAGSLGAGREESTWILSAYLVANAIILPASGWFSNAFGRKRFFLFCIVGFGVASLLCGMAPTIEILVLFRLVQGLAGGGLQPSSQAILADAFPQEQRGMAFAFYGVAVVFAPAIGPTLGGWITDNYSWRWIFLINVPVSIVLVMVVNIMIDDPQHMKDAREQRRQRKFSMDYTGFGLLALGLGALQLMLDTGQQHDWFSAHYIVATAVISAVALIAFVAWVWDHKDPIVDLSLLRDRNFAIANSMMFFVGFVLFGSTALLPIFVQSMLDYSAMDAGLVISPGAFLIMLLMPVVGRLVGLTDPRRLILLGLSMGGFALYSMAQFTLEADYWTVAIARIYQSAGIALIFIPISTIAYVNVPPDKSNFASALLNLARNLGGAVGIAFLSTLLSRREQVHHNMLVGNISPFDPSYRAYYSALQQQFLAAAPNPEQAGRMANEVLSRTVDQQAQLLAFVDAFHVLSLSFLILIPLVFLMRPSATQSTPQAAAATPAKSASAKSALGATRPAPSAR